MTIEISTKTPATESGSGSELLDRYRATRALSIDLCRPLSPEDYRIQTMPDVSPPWWNLGHTTWFFAKNILEPHVGYRFPHAGYEFALNSYYEAHGARLARAERGSVSRPTTEEVLQLRADVDRRMEELLDQEDHAQRREIEFLTITGIQHEQQHQELLITEIKHILGSNHDGFRAPYATDQPPTDEETGPLGWIDVADEQIATIGHDRDAWCWDNELPAHRTLIAPFALADRLITVGEYLEFMDAGAYESPLLWLSNGWAAVESQGWRAPLYWERRGDDWQVWTLNGLRALRMDEPVAHVSFYEADAYACWRSLNDPDTAGARLPTEQEWEVLARRAFTPSSGTFLEDRVFHPRSASSGSGLRQAAGDLWEWTSSHYEPYPGYRPFEGDLMEYNGKFMDNQRVLRGGSCATPRDHIRVSYRNFWPADTRFQFTGIRLARSLSASG